MPDYRRYRVPGGTYFFTVNLLERRLDTLVRHIDLLRAAVRVSRMARPFHIDAWVVLPDHSIQPPLQQIHREKIRPARHPKPPIIRHPSSFSSNIHASNHPPLHPAKSASRKADARRVIRQSR